ncbi:MAG TPA: helix-turn-helix transcriptional regulator [Gemmata sp.]
MKPEEVKSRADRYAGWFGPRLRELRDKAGLTQAALAKAIGMSQARIAEYEGPKAFRPSWETVLRLCFALDIEPQAFMREPVEKENAESRLTSNLDGV